MFAQIDLENAQRILLDRLSSLSSEYVVLTEGLNRVISENLFAVQDHPLNPQAAVDGFAVCGLPGGDSFRLLESPKNCEIRNLILKPGEGVRVTTGGLLPGNTEAVIPDEKIQKTSGEIIKLGQIVPGSNIKNPGEDFRRGELLAARGTCLSTGLIGLLMAFGYYRVPVFCRPKVLILSLGPQIVPCHVTPGPGEIRDSNGPLLGALSTKEGGRVIDIRTAGNKDLEESLDEISELFTEADLIITTGGTFDGQYNAVNWLFQKMNVETIFREVRMKPGCHNSAGFWKGRPVISLSGNPAACLVGFELLAAPVLRVLQGLNPNLKRVSGVCRNSYSGSQGPRCFLRGRLNYCEKGWTVDVLPGQKSSMMKSFINCNALIDLPAGRPSVQVGEEVSVILLTPFHFDLFAG